LKCRARDQGDERAPGTPPSETVGPAADEPPRPRGGLLLLLLLLLRRRRVLQVLMPERHVLFVCVENAARSLIAEAAFNADPPPGWSAESGGTRPAAAPNPRTGAMLAEVGLPLPRHAPALVSDAMIDRAELRVTMGCLDDASCPARLKTFRLRDWGLDDPARLDDAGFRRVRDEILDLVRRLRAELLLDERRVTTSETVRRS